MQHLDKLIFQCNSKLFSPISGGKKINSKKIFVKMKGNFNRLVKLTCKYFNKYRKLLSKGNKFQVNKLK